MQSGTPCFTNQDCKRSLLGNGYWHLFAMVKTCRFVVLCFYLVRKQLLTLTNVREKICSKNKPRSLKSDQEQDLTLKQIAVIDKDSLLRPTKYYVAF